MSDIQQRVIKLRDTLELNQSEFAVRLDIKRPTLAGYEKGTFPPSTDFLVKLHKIYNVNTAWLLTGEGEMFLHNDKYDHARRIMEIRIHKGLDRKKFAKELGVSLGIIEDIEETGGAVSSDFTKKLQEKFNVNYEWFATGKGKVFMHDPDEPSEDQDIPNSKPVKEKPDEGNFHNKEKHPLISGLEALLAQQRQTDQRLEKIENQITELKQSLDNLGKK